MVEKKEKRYVSDNAQLMAEWNYEKNVDLNPSQLTLGSNKKAWWKCSKGHEWQSTINNRSNGNGCPYCSGKKVLQGYNDLTATNPVLACEWNYEKNGDLKPEKFSKGSNKKVWWKCKKGHEWQASISHRNNGRDCPYCAGKKIIIDENDLQTVNPSLANEWNYEKNNGLTPMDVMPNGHDKVWWKCSKGHEWQASIYSRNKGNGCPYCAGQKVIEGYNDLQTVNSFLANEWNYEKNNGLTPIDVMPFSNKKVWWKCKNGHEWQASISHRNNGRNCPYCSGRKVLVGYNDLATLNFNVAKEWNYEKNKDLKPEMFTASSNKKVWWKCSIGHEWQAIIGSRNKGKGCPYCASRKTLQGYNDLITTNPNLVKEWNYEKNKDITPKEVTSGSNKKVWWKCNKGHEWQAIVGSRNKGIGCPICDLERKTSFPEYALEYYLEKCNINVIHSYKGQGYELDIYIPSRKIAIEYDGEFWHKGKTEKDLEKNERCKKDGIKLYRIRENLPSLNDSSIDYIIRDNQKELSKALEKILCEILETDVNVDLERDAPYIENLREYTEKESSLLSLNPDLAKEWNYDKNSDLKPEHVFPNSHKKVWWKCSKGHEWQASICNRSKGRGCPYCSNKKVLEGFNDLQTTNPTLAIEWNYEKNNVLKPVDVVSNCNKKVWWKCKNGHEWQARIADRNKGLGCPYCAGQRVIQGINDLQTVNPSLASEWNYEKNNGLTPIDVMPNSHNKVWWKCKNGHEWQARISNRNSNNRGCPYCTGQRVIQGINDLQTVNPRLASEWNYGKNNGLTPADVMPNSHHKVWWKCNEGHEWQATIAHRNNGRGCPECYKDRRKSNKD